MREGSHCMLCKMTRAMEHTCWNTFQNKTSKEQGEKEEKNVEMIRLHVPHHTTYYFSTFKWLLRIPNLAHGATTFIIMAVSRMAISITIWKWENGKWPRHNHTRCFYWMSFMLSVAFKTIVLNVVMLSIVMLSPNMLSAVASCSIDILIWKDDRLFPQGFISKRGKAK